MMDKINVLLIEDDPDDVELLEAAFNDHQVPFLLHVIAQGDKVIPFINDCEKLPDVIVLDLNLPKMHGREILRLIKSNDRFKLVPVVILTTSSTRQDCDYCMEAGAENYLVKPGTMAAYGMIIETITSVAIAERAR